MNEKEAVLKNLCTGTKSFVVLFPAEIKDDSKPQYFASHQLFAEDYEVEV